MKEIRIHGRGGQGSLVLAQFMAIAALEDGKYGQAFPYLGGGGERRGKPIVAFCRLSDRPIRVRSRIYEPDYVIVQDATILGEIDVEEGLKPDGMVLINTERSVGDLKLKSQNVIVDICRRACPSNSWPSDNQYRSSRNFCRRERRAFAAGCRSSRSKQIPW